MKNKLQLLLVAAYLGFAGWWLSFQDIAKDQGLSVQRYGATYGILALLAAMIGFMAMRKWGGFKTVLGKALFFFSMGALAQEVGQLIYTYYVYGAKVEIPYPSWGDVGYFASVLFYIAGSYFLCKMTGLKFSLQKNHYKLIAIALPCIILAISYSVFLRHYEYTKPLTAALDFGYPLGEAVYLSLALMAYISSRKLLGGAIRKAILITIFALFVQYTADFTFLYQTSHGTWYAGGVSDLIYLTAYFIFGIALLSFSNVYHSIKQVEKP